MRNLGDNRSCGCLFRGIGCRRPWAGLLERDFKGLVSIALSLDGAILCFWVRSYLGLGEGLRLGHSSSWPSNLGFRWDHNVGNV